MHSITASTNLAIAAATQYLLSVSKEIGLEQIPKSTIAALGKMPGSGNHGQTAKHRQYSVNVAGLGSTQL